MMTEQEQAECDRALALYLHIFNTDKIPARDAATLAAAVYAKLPPVEVDEYPIAKPETICQPPGFSDKRR